MTIEMGVAMPTAEPKPAAPVAVRALAVVAAAVLTMVAACAMPSRMESHAAASTGGAMPVDAAAPAVAAPALPATAAAARADDKAVARGRKIAFSRSLGNCLACHTMKGGDVPSDVGPELANLAARYPDPHDLYAIIYDEQRRNPQTVMPPFGRNLILGPQQISDVVAFLYTE